MAQAVDAALIAGSASIVVGVIAASASAWQARGTRRLQQRLADEERELQQQLGKEQRRLQEQLAEQQHEWDAKLAELSVALEKQGKAEERELDAQEALHLFRLPLRYAAVDLGHRIDNIRTRDFWDYVTTDNRRREIAVLGTAYRFARWFATLETLYDRAEFLRLEHQRASDPESKPVFATLAAIGKAFASDKHDRAEPNDFLSSRFMIWREEQRALGELARDRDRDSVGGFAMFATRARGCDARWVANFIEDLEACDAPRSERLKLIQTLLADLVRQLDPDKSYLVRNDRGEETEPNWMQPDRQIPLSA